MWLKDAWTYLIIVIFAFILVQGLFEAVCLVDVRASLSVVLTIHIFKNRPIFYVTYYKF